MANKGNAWDILREDLRKQGCEKWEIDYARTVVKEYNLNYIHDEFANIGSRSTPLESLTKDLLQTLDDERFTELHDSTSDTMPEIAEYDLSYEQITKLSPAEKQEYRDKRAKLFSEQKAILSHGQTNFEEKMTNLGLKSEEESNKKSTIIPPKGLWGVSDTYYYIKGVAERFDTIGKYLQDIAKQVYVFKLETGLDKETVKLLESYHDERMIPLWELSLTGSEEIINILENIQDEKNRDTALGWMKKGMDKHWNYGNHGAGEVDYIQTGEYIFRLGKTENVIVRVPIKREFTREQVGDKTTVKLLDITNQVHIKCPECGLKFNKPIVGDEERDLFAGDLFYKATNILLENKLSQAVEEICDNAIFVEHKTPQQWFKEKTGKEGIDIKVYEEKPEKVKTENLDPKDRAVMGYNVYWGRAHRTADKSEHFSNEA